MKTLLFGAAAILAMAAANAVSAQSIDYGSLQQLFNEPVTTSATGSPLRSTEAPVDMTIITADDIKRSGATDLPTILSRVPGIDILSWGAGDADVSVRGYNQAYSPRLLVLINGRQVFLDDYGYTAWSTLPVTLSEIRQIEVIRGPNSALFGFNAVGGVVNIITYNPKYDNTNSVEAHGGTQGDAGGSVVTTLHAGDKVAVRLSGGGERQDEWQNAANDPTMWKAHGAFDGVAQLAPNTELRLQGSLSRASYTEMTPVDRYDVATYATKSLMGTLTSDTPYGQVQAQSYINTVQDNIPSTDTIIKNQVEVASLQDLFKIGQQSTFRFADEYRNNIENLVNANTGHIGYHLISPSAMWTFAATRKLSLSVAGRIDSLDLHHSGTIAPGFQPSDISDWNRTTTTFSANAGVVYKLTDLDTARATYARGFQLPSLVELGAAQLPYGSPPSGLSVGGNPDLQPTVVSNYQLSYDRNIPQLNAQAGAKIFYQQNKLVQGQWNFAHPEYAATATANAETVFENASNSDMTGFELSASGKLKAGFHWSADTTYTNIWDRALDGYSLIGKQVDYAKSTPKYRGNLALGWADNHWSADGFIHYITQ